MTVEWELLSWFVGCTIILEIKGIWDDPGAASVKGTAKEFKGSFGVDGKRTTISTSR